MRMGIFAKRDILIGEELTFNYNVDRYGSVFFSLNFYRRVCSSSVFWPFAATKRSLVIVTNPTVSEHWVERLRQMWQVWTTCIWTVSSLFFIFINSVSSFL